MIITARRLFDGSGSSLTEDATVIVRGDRIYWVGPAAGATLDPGEEKLNLGDATLLPGLIDMHNHLRISHADGDLSGQMRDSEVAYVLRGLRNLETNLRAGVTTMELNGDRAFLDVQMREAVKTGLARGPRLFVAGKGIKSSRCTGDVVATAICDDSEAIRAAGWDRGPAASPRTLGFSRNGEREMIELCSPSVTSISWGYPHSTRQDSL
jgi:imidazolonepropionase-like amidohydrolase